MRILLFGAQGQLGKEVQKVFKDHDVVPLDYDDCDIISSAALNETLLAHTYSAKKVDFLINCAGATETVFCEGQPLFAYKVNAFAPLRMAQFCEANDITMVQISTDYVFSGESDHYIESDTPCPVNVYGLSKLSGEQAVAAYCSNHYIIRTSALYGNGSAPDRPNFVDKILYKLAQGEPFNVIGNEFTRPTYTVDLANKIYELLTERYLKGTYHITNQGEVSWYDFAMRIAMHYGSTVTTLTPEMRSPTPLIRNVMREYVDRGIKRPQHSNLISNRFYGERMRCWEDALRSYFDEREDLYGKER